MLYVFIFILIVIIAYAVYARLDKWVEARSNEVPISIAQMGLMRFRGVPIDETIAALTKTTKAGINISYDQ
ncbi:MAG TPA: flotillin-like FloA family protein, partial [Chitinophagales bacterium]|nr:flotillin-like FloA family protein [Chitinophagales bacterium]